MNIPNEHAVWKRERTMVDSEELQHLKGGSLGEVEWRLRKEDIRGVKEWEQEKLMPNSKQRWASLCSAVSEVSEDRSHCI